MKITFGVSLGSPLVQQQPTREKKKRKKKHTQPPRARNARTQRKEKRERKKKWWWWSFFFFFFFTSLGATLLSHPFCGRTSAPNSLVMRTAPPPGCRSARSVRTTHGKNHGHKRARADKKTWRVGGKKRTTILPAPEQTVGGGKTHKASTRIRST